MVDDVHQTLKDESVWKWEMKPGRIKRGIGMLCVLVTKAYPDSSAN